MKVTAKETFEKLSQQQKELMEKIGENTNTLIGLFQPDEELTEAGTVLAKEYFEKSQALMEDMMKPENLEKFFEKAPALFTEAIELNNTYFNKTLEHYRNFWQSYSTEKWQSTAKEWSELTQATAKAIVDSSNEGAKTIKEAFA